MLDNYAVYDCLLNYWIEILQDDVYAIKADGYEAGREIIFEFGRRREIKSFDGELIPKEIIERKYFSDDLAALNLLVDESAEIDSELEEMREENSGDDGLFAEVLSDKGTISKDALKKRIRQLEEKNIFDDEHNALKKYFAKLDEKSVVDKKIENSRAALDKKIIEKNSVLTVDEIKYLLFNLKWTAKIQADIRGEFEQILNSLSRRVILLAKRYEHTLGELENKTTKSKAAVVDALERMGFQW